MAGRRTALGIGAAALGVGAAGGVLRAWQQGVFSAGRGPAYEPWNTWQHAGVNAGLHPVHAAILAASPHNSQPWRFRVGPDRVDLLVDPARNIGTIDPFRREMYMGLGCALENLVQAAVATERAARVAMFPAPADPNFVASVAFEPGPRVTSPLYAAIPRRHTNRGAYERNRELSASVFAALQSLGSDFPRIALRGFTTPTVTREIGARIVEATQAIVADRDQSRDSALWFRNSWDEVQRRRDGLTIDAQALPGWVRLAAKLLPPASAERADRFWLEATRDVHVATAPAFGVLLARDASDNAQRVEGGRIWQRLHLWATAEGLAMHPLNQMPERADRERSLGIAPIFGNVLKGLVGDDRWDVLMPFRIGYPTVAALPSPRRSLEEVLVT